MSTWKHATPDRSLGMVDKEISSEIKLLYGPSKLLPSIGFKLFVIDRWEIDLLSFTKHFESLDKLILPDSSFEKVLLPS